MSLWVLGLTLAPPTVILRLEDYKGKTPRFCLILAISTVIPIVNLLIVVDFIFDKLKINNKQKQPFGNLLNERNIKNHYFYGKKQIWKNKNIPKTQ